MSESNCIYYTEKFPNAQFTELEFKQAHIEDLLPFKCEHCGKIFYRSKRAAYKRNPKYCNQQCTKQAKKAEMVTGNCPVCGRLITKRREYYIRHPTFFCNKSCRAVYHNTKDKSVFDHVKPNLSLPPIEQFYTPTYENHICKICGAKGYSCRDIEICSSHLWYSSESLYALGFNKDVLGTEHVYDEYNRIRSMLLRERNLATLCLALSSRGILPLTRPKIVALVKFFRLNVDISCLELKSTRAVSLGKTYIHTTWNNEIIKCRSINEVSYAMTLDQNQTPYQFEKLRIVYYDSYKHRNVKSKPDFYLPNCNTIVEVKSGYTYKQQIMVDRMKRFHELGYNFKLILDFIEYDNFCPEDPDISRTVYDLDNMHLYKV